MLTNLSFTIKNKQNEIKHKLWTVEPLKFRDRPFTELGVELSLIWV